MIRLSIAIASFLAAVFASSTTSTNAFAPVASQQSRVTDFSLFATTSAVPPPPPATSPDNVRILSNANAVGNTVRHLVQEAAEAAIAKRGYFALAIPGGSILKMLVGDDIIGDWTTKTTIAYVNHKCVPMDDAELATHAKARALFLDAWSGANTLIMDGTDQGATEAASYDAKLKALSPDILPRNENGLPVFDLALIGVGDDGHVGSLYPDRDEVLMGGSDDSATGAPWVLPVEMKQPPSITLTLPVMAAARQVVVAACGVSDKYPQGKSAGMRRAVADPTETIQTFPAVGLRGVAIWIMDEAASSKLGDAYSRRL